MTDCENIKTEKTDTGIFTITLNRPEKRNAFTYDMIRALNQIFQELNSSDSCKIAVIKGEGSVFCSGIEMSWIMDGKNMDKNRCFTGFSEITELFYRIYELRVPVLCVLDGPVIGGGVGFAAASDYVIASEKADFYMSGARYGLIATCTAPFIIKRTGEHLAKRFFLTGEKISPKRALEMNLIDELVKSSDLSCLLSKRTEVFLSNSPYALEKSKKLFSKIPVLNKKEIIDYTAEILLQSVHSQEVQEGIKSFLNKEEPPRARKNKIN